MLGTKPKSEETRAIWKMEIRDMSKINVTIMG